MHKIVKKLQDNLQSVIVGKEEVIELFLTAFFSGGHVLLEDLPGSGKTTLAKALAASMESEYKRIQFTPDLLPADITGLNIFNNKEQEFTFVKGPAFTNVLLADEINRATPRTQSALLECMEESQITVDGVTYALPTPFFVVATQNPIETSGTFPLPEAQMDRFTMQLSLGFPDVENEVAMLKKHEQGLPVAKLQAVITKEEFLAFQQEADNVTIDDSLIRYIAELADATRKHENLPNGISPRGSLALFHCAKVYAAMQERSYVVPDDIKKLVVPVLAHRLSTSGGFLKRNAIVDILMSIVEGIPVPTENWKK